jgi:hypothetical protein
MVEEDDKDEQDSAPDGRYAKEIDRAPRDDVIRERPTSAVGAAPSSFTTSGRRRFSSARVIAMQTATHARGRDEPPLHSQPPVNPARRSPAITAGQPRMMSQMRPDR